MARWQSLAYYSGLENRRRLIAVQGFESLPRRQILKIKRGESVASITINSTTLTPASINNIYLQKANANYTCNATKPSNYQYTRDNTNSSGEGTIHTYKYSYSKLTYAWKFSDGSSSALSSGTHTFTSLSQGASNSIKANVDVSCTETLVHSWTTYTWVDNGDYEDQGKWVETDKVDANGKPIKEWKENWVWVSDWDLESESHEKTTTSNLKSSGSASATVYTRPGVFSDYNFVNNVNAIESSEGLTVKKVSNWCTHCGKFLSWSNQSNKYNAAENCKVSKGDLITAEWYNKCAKLCGCSTRVSNDQTKNNSLITAQVFKDLGAAISKNDIS